jgi:hypothetical protein
MEAEEKMLTTKLQTHEHDIIPRVSEVLVCTGFTFTKAIFTTFFINWAGIKFSSTVPLKLVVFLVLLMRVGPVFFQNFRI